MSVHKATLEDLEIIFRMALEFNRNAPYALFTDEATIVARIKHFIQEGSVFVDDEGHGFIAGTIVPFIYGDCKQAIELAWWVDEDQRKTGLGFKLLEEFECWAAANGARLVTMISLDDHVGKFYEKQGYTLAERTYMKDLKPWQRHHSEETK